MYSRGHYARNKFFGSMKNILWSAITLTITAILIGAFVYGCSYYYNIMGPAIE